jgi:predicted RNA-binding Zn-ribbon protein involved in translation (DUF1610 family)
MSDPSVSSCEYCGFMLPQYAYSFCPNCGSLVADSRKDRMLSRLFKVSGGKHYSNLLAKLPYTTSGIMRHLANNVDGSIGMPVMAAANVVRDPKVSAVAKDLARKSPEIAQVIMGFTPLAPYSMAISKLLEKAIQQTNGQSNNMSELQTAMFCSECGQRLTSSYKFCPKCGNALN